MDFTKPLVWTPQSLRDAQRESQPPVAMELSPSKRRHESPAQRPIVTEPDSDEEPPQKGSKQIPKPQSPQPSTQDEAASMQAILIKQNTDAKLEIAQAREAILADAREEVANIE